MGDALKAVRRAPMTMRCAWCGRIRVGITWVLERRQAKVLYSHGLCPECRKRHFEQMTGQQET